MTDKQQKAPASAEERISDAEIEREIRSKRRFSIAEAIGRNAGDLMKGASPVTRQQQAVFVVEEILERHLKDSEGALGEVLLSRVETSEALLENYDDPLTALVGVVRKLLDSAESLNRFVVKIDAHWGQIYFERPHFERDGRSPDHDDPYTRESVHATLTELLETLEEHRGEDS